MSLVVAASAGTTRAYACATSGGGASGAAHASGITPSRGSSRWRNIGSLVVWTRADGTGSGHPRAAALAPDDPSVVTQQVIGGDHGAAADGQRRREGPVGRQRLARRQLSLVDRRRSRAASSTGRGPARPASGRGVR